MGRLPLTQEGKRSVGKDKERTKPDEMFDSLVRNAIDFFRHSVAALPQKPKYSVINFCAAVELFLKARLMLEHWSLLCEDLRSANLIKFRNGDCRSISLDDAIRRLENIVGVNITRKEKEIFSQLRDRRNRLVHFLDPTYAVKPDSATLHAVVAEQCKGWYYLHRLLTERWRSEFQKYLDGIGQLHQLMRKQRGFLQAKFEDILPSIEKGKKRGIAFSTCYACGFEASKEESVKDKTLVTMRCLVCGEHTHQLQVPCPKCNSTVLISELGGGQCENCGGRIDTEYLLDLYGEWQGPEDRLVALRHAYCAECKYTEQPTVVPFGDEWLCLFCLTLYHGHQVSRCGWCGELATGEVGDYYSPGCLMCAVHIIRDADHPSAT